MRVEAHDSRWWELRRQDIRTDIEVWDTACYAVGAEPGTIEWAIIRRIPSKVLSQAITHGELDLLLDEVRRDGVWSDEREGY